MKNLSVKLLNNISKIFQYKKLIKKKNRKKIKMEEIWIDFEKIVDNIFYVNLYEIILLRNKEWRILNAIQIINKNIKIIFIIECTNVNIIYL